MLYAEYMASSEWRRKRTARLTIDHHRCRLCGATGNLQVHHNPLSYRLIPSESIEDDLTTVCQRCHVFVTNICRADKRAGKNRYMPRWPVTRREVVDTILLIVALIVILFVLYIATGG